MDKIEGLEKELAHKAAVLDLSSFCRPLERDGLWWYNTANVLLSQSESVSKALRYLELTARLERHSGDRQLVRVVEEPGDASDRSPNKLCYLLPFKCELLPEVLVWPQFLV